MNAFAGKLKSIERIEDFPQGGYMVRLELFVPLDVSTDEMEVYRRVAKVVKLITEKETNKC